MTRTITIMQVKSAIGRHKSHQACLIGLGIKRLHQVVQVQATPENLGMINKISYLLRIED